MKAILVGTQYQNTKYDLEISIHELKELSYACGIDVKDVIIQKITSISPQFYIGKGKVLEIKKLLTEDDIVIFNEELTPLQLKNLVDVLAVEVTDRSDLILRIFESRARSKEAKLQVKIARLNYILPRLAGMNENLYSQQGGSGFRGRGEKQIELDRRIIRRQLLQAQKELKAIVKQRQTQRRLRKRNQQKVVCLVGYTNSGKSSLLNYFSQKKVLEKDMLFASLQTASRQVLLKEHYPIIMSDTVGFINQLPHHLIQAFRSTLEEVKEADLLLEIIDASSSYCEQQIETTAQVLETLGVKDTPMIYVYNKVDKQQTLIQPHKPYIFISIKENLQLNELEDLIVQALFKDYEVVHFIIPYKDGFVFQDIKHKYEVLKEEYLDDGIYLSCIINKQAKQQYAQYIQ